MKVTKFLKNAGIIRKTARQTQLVAAIVGAVLAVFCGWLVTNRSGGSLVTLSYDMPFMRHRAGGASDIRIVYLSDFQQGAYRLDRRTQAGLLDKLAEAGAKAVVYDIIFDATTEYDVEFAASIRRFRGVDQDGKPLPGMPQRRVFLACGRETFSQAGMTGEKLIPPNDVLLDAADDFGLVCWDDDSFMIRKVSSGTIDEPSLIWKAAVALGAPGLNEGNRMDIRWMNYAGPPTELQNRYMASPIMSVDASRLIEGWKNPDLIRDKIVLIGAAPEKIGQALGTDQFNTPYHRFQIRGKLDFMSGVEVQANGLANLLQGNFLRRSGAGFDQLLVIVAGILAGFAFTYVRPLSGIVLAISSAVAAGVSGYWSIKYAQVWFPWSVVAFVQIPIALVWGIAAHSYVEKFFRIKISDEQKVLREVFAKYLSPQMLEQMSAQDFKANLGGEKVHAAVMFTDLEGFTDMCERVRDPARIVEVLNDYFQRTTGSIFDHDGVIIKFLGDAIFAAWGVPLALENAPSSAALAAWKLFENDKFFVEGVELRTRIGLHYDEVVAGNVGSSRHMDYTLIGDAVNLASRLEGLNKMMGTHILMSECFQSRLGPEFRSRPVGRFRFKGRAQVTVVHELIGPVVEQSEPVWIDQYRRALAALESGDQALALELFNEADASRGARGDGPSRYFVNRIQSGQINADGTVDLKEK